MTMVLITANSMKLASDTYNQKKEPESLEMQVN